MDKSESVFNTLSKVNVNEHIKKKGNLSYLSWPFAWGTLKEYYPDSNYELIEPVTYDDGTCEVSVNVTVGGVTHNMTLPVMDHKNSAVKNPDSRKISDARMRCLVKCIAMFGLGLYIYAGEDIPTEDSREKEAKNKEISDEMIRLIENDDIAFTQIYRECNQQEREVAWKILNTKQQAVARKMLFDTKETNND